MNISSLVTFRRHSACSTDAAYAARLHVAGDADKDGMIALLWTALRRSEALSSLVHLRPWRLLTASEAADIPRAMVFNRKRPLQVVPPSEPSVQAGPHLLEADGLLAPWYLAYRLAEEMERARTHGRPLAVAIMSSLLLPNERLTVAARIAAAGAASLSSRAGDIIGWLDREQLIVVMPETGATEARCGLDRICSEVHRRSMSVGGQKWRPSLVEDALEYSTAAELMRALSGDDTLQAAA